MPDGTTDRTRWRLLDERGRQRWRYLRTDEEVKEWPQSTADRYHLGLPVESPTLPLVECPLDAARNGLTFFEHLQLPPGNWACEYGGPMFLLPGLVITWYVTDTEVPEEYGIEICNYLFARQNQEDWGWGLHIEGITSVFGTAMNYTTLRLLGVSAEDPRMVKAKATLHKMGGALNGPHWAKFWLSVLGVCEWDAVNPVPPELWLLPDWFPIAPWRWWVHMRQVFLPMSFIWSRKYKFPLTGLTTSLREELYTQPYQSIKWSAHRNDISPYDNYHPKTPLLNAVNWLLVNVHNPITRFNFLKRRAEDWTYELIQMEDKNTDFANLGPVNAPMNMVACYIREGLESEAVKKHRERMDDFLWMKSEGMLMNGTNGVQTWDTSFLIQAVVESDLAREPRWYPMLLKALEFLEDQQILEECERQHECYRHSRKGAWAFSTREQGYTVSDCTAEGMKSVLMLQEYELPDGRKPFPKLVSDERLQDAVDVLLTMQNASGSYASYEPIRGNAEIMERLNAAEVFGRIMVEYDYPECTTAVVTALTLFRKYYPAYRREEIDRVCKSALSYIYQSQRDDGSWYGSWGICFSYAGMFALETIRITSGEMYKDSERVKKACRFLIDKQNEDGGWGESYKSCEDGVWTQHPQGSQVVQTAWVIIALLEADYPTGSEGEFVVDRAVQLLVNRQQPNGEWLQEAIEGVFNKTCMISYPNYKFIFPIKALGMYAKKTKNRFLSK